MDRLLCDPAAGNPQSSSDSPPSGDAGRFPGVLQAPERVGANVNGWVLATLTDEVILEEPQSRQQQPEPTNG